MKKIILSIYLLNITVFAIAQNKAQFQQIEQSLRDYKIEQAEQQLNKFLKKKRKSTKKQVQLLYLQAQLLQLKGNYIAANQFAKKALARAKPSQKSKILTFQGALWLDLDQYDLADSLLNKAHVINKQNLRISPSLKATTIYRLALLNVGKKQYTLADSLYALVKNDLESANLTNSMTYVKVLYSMGESKLEQHQLEEAKKILQDANHKLDFIATTEEHFEKTIIWTHLGRLEQLRGKNKSALAYYEKAIEKQARTLGSQHLYYTKTLMNKGQAYRELGEYAKAESLLLEVKSLLQSELKETAIYGHAMILLGIIYGEMGKRAAGIDSYLAAKDVFFQLNDISGYSNVLNELAVIYANNGKLEESTAFLEEGKIFLEQNQQDKTQNYMATLINLGLNYVDLNQLEKAKPILAQAKNLVYEILGEEHNYYATVVSNLAKSHEKTKQYQQAKKLYLETERIDKIVLGEKHPYFMSTLASTANIYALLNDKNQALNYYQRLIKGQTSLIYNYYSTFEEDTRLSYLKESTKYFEEYFSFIARQDSISPSAHTEMQNISLATKSLALDFSVDNKIQIDSLQDTEANTFFKEWTALRQQLSQAYTMSEQEKKGAGFDLTTLEEQVILVEKKLVRSNEAMAQQLNRQQIVTFEAIEAGLTAQEAAIDFIKFRYRPPTGTTDSILYGALLTRSGDTAPQFFQLAEEKQLVRLLKAKIRSNGSNYIANPKVGYVLYELLWQPLQPYLTDIKTIKISPTGLLHKVAFAALPTEQSGEKTLMHQFRFDYYSNLKGLVQPSKQPTFKETSIALVGGANFDLDSLALLDLAKDLGTSNTTINENQILAAVSSISNTRGADVDSTRAAIRFNYLQGTEKEVASIAQQLTDQKWQVQKLTGAAALEDRVKLLSGKYAPAVLHIATHGYFFSPLKNRKASSQTLKDRIQAATNPLVRSGLVFTGVNHTWQGGGRIPNLNDGVLTAYEISNLDLFNTDLVVLSACETGLGDIYDTEGVFGLQRAFKMAGVQQLITSLWKVPDSQTSELMNLFYQHYIISNDAAQALYKAQLTLSQQYPPYYWAAFILVE